MKTSMKYEGGSDTYRLVLINLKTLEIYKTREEIEKERANKEKERIGLLEKDLKEFKNKNEIKF
ncbi:MAG: hypothetical protein ACTSQO_13205 [Candidatus Helarchaeota archaeon]